MYMYVVHTLTILSKLKLTVCIVVFAMQKKCTVVESSGDPERTYNLQSEFIRMVHENYNVRVTNAFACSNTASSQRKL